MIFNHWCQGWLNSLKVVRAQLTNKTHFYCKKLNSYEHLQILWGQMPPVPLVQPPMKFGVVYRSPSLNRDESTKTCVISETC